MDPMITKVGEPGAIATLEVPGKAVGATSIKISSDAKFPKNSFFVFKIGVKTGSEIDQATVTTWLGKITASNTISQMTLLSGDDREYAANAETVIYIAISSVWANMLAEALLKTLKPDGTPIKDLIYNPGYNDFNHQELLKEGRWVFSVSSAVNAMANKPVGQAGWLETKNLTKGMYPGVHPWSHAHQEYQAIDKNTYVRMINSGATPTPINFGVWIKKLKSAENEVGRSVINWKEVFPVGEFKYFSTNVNPNMLYPGTTWTRRTGYFLWAGEDSGSYSVGKTFGSSTHTLTVNEMPSHRHSVGWNNENGGYLPANNSWANAVNVRSQANYSFSDRLPNGHNNTGLLGYTGGNQPHNNMPPARSVYLWERTA